MNHYKSSLMAFSKLIDALEKLPSIGKKSAQKMAYTLCIEDRFLGLNIAHAIESASRVVQTCRQCGGLSEGEICEICLNSTRQNGELCIVASPRDILTIEDMGEFGGRYFVLAQELERIDFTLINQRIKQESINEVIFALSPSIANDAVILYVEDKIVHSVKFSKIAQGIPTGIGLDSIDQLSLSRSLNFRVKI